MKTLAIDCSSSQASLALLDQDQCMYEATWPAQRAAGSPLLEQVASGRSHVGWRWEQIDLFVIGRGPGNYTSLRTSFAVIQALALPGQTPLYPLSSALAIAADALEQSGSSRVAVLGDARRNTCWRGVFEKSARQIVRQVVPWQLLPLRDAALGIEPGLSCASPEFSSLRTRNILDAFAANTPWLQHDLLPRATQLARIALARQQHNEPPEPSQPFYPHPATATVPAPPDKP